MLFESLLKESKKYFPNIQIKFKDTSKFMKFLSFLLFFHKDFSTNFVTTIGNTIYFPNEKEMNDKPITSSITLLHELVHVYDSQQTNILYFSLLYLFPQILALMFFPLLLISWKLSLLSLLFLLPLPAYFRMNFEKRAYIVSLYTWHRLGLKKDFVVDLDLIAKDYKQNFKSYEYYFMWLFNLDKEFDSSLNKIKNMQRPYEDKVFDILDELIEKS